MAIRVRIDGSYIEVDNEADLRLVLSVLGKAQTALPFNTPPTKPHNVAPGGAPTFLSLVTLPRPKLLLEILANHPNGLWDTEIHQRINVKDNLAMSGVLTSIYRTGKKCGLEPEDIIIKRTEGSPPNKRYHYTMTQGVREAYSQLHPGRLPEVSDTTKTVNGVESHEDTMRLIRM